MRGVKAKALRRLAVSLGYRNEVMRTGPFAGLYVAGIRRYKRYFLRRYGKTPEVAR